MPKPTSSFSNLHQIFRHRPVLAAVIVLVSSAHIALLQNAGADRPVIAVTADALPTTRVRLIEARPIDEAPVVPPAPPVVRHIEPEAAAHRAAMPVEREAKAEAKARPEPGPDPDPVVVIVGDEGGVNLVPVADVSGSATTQPPATTVPDPIGAEASAPMVTYPTKVPKPFTFRYAMQRGQLGGVGELQWKRAGEQYEARLQGTVGGLPILSWVSTGTVVSGGLAPVRYVDRRLGKSDQAANFQRAESKITFSGSSTEYPMAAGAQDRLSWMIQLPSILGGDPSKARAGSRVGVFVVGAHGDAETWIFQSAGSEPVRTPSGTVASNKWMREPRKPFDTKVEVWLDPARQYLPVKARLTQPPSDSPLELSLSEALP